IDEHTLDGILKQDVIEESDDIKYKYSETEAASQTSTQETETQNTNGKKKSKILIVEDDIDMREYIKNELEQDYHVSLANDGTQGIEQAIKINPDLIISDIMMPQMDGIEFCKKIKTDERTSHIAIILLTARSSQEHKIEGLETGADDYLTKPFFINELRLRIDNIIESRRRLRERFGKLMQIEPSELQITSLDQKFIERAIKIVEENINNPTFGIEKFSRLLGVSRVGLYNKLKVLTNYTVQEFIFVVKLKRAAQLLLSSGMSVTQVCYEVGFKDPSHFSKLFKKQFGVSPKSYKDENSNQSK
ncbi:MAG: DNA-binding response regulator, partial [Calditrichaeota bacterium]